MTNYNRDLDGVNTREWKKRRAKELRDLIKLFERDIKVLEFMIKEYGEQSETRSESVREKSV